MITRPALRYHGGKYRIARWIISHFPEHRTYVEPFGGAASVLLKKPRSFAEVYNDLDDEVVNLFQVLRDPQLAAQLKHACERTAYARAEFELAYQPCDDRVERSRRLLVRSFMGHGSSGIRLHRTGFRSNNGRTHTIPAHDWQNWPASVPTFVERLRGVIIEKRPAAQVIAAHDGPDTLFYVDPPYPFSTRSQKRVGNDLYHGYRHELTDAEHAELIDQLLGVEGKVIVSGYSCPLYDRAFKGWRRFKRATRSDRARPRTEVLWVKPSAKVLPFAEAAE